MLVSIAFQLKISKQSHILSKTAKQKFFTSDVSVIITYEESQINLLELKKTACVIKWTTLDKRGIVCGVSQGSVVGLVLFVVYMNDLAKCVASHGISLGEICRLLY